MLFTEVLNLIHLQGVREGVPWHLSGMTDAPTDWLVALGYPSAETPPATAIRLAADDSTPQLELVA